MNNLKKDIVDNMQPLIYIAVSPELFEQTGLASYVPAWERYAAVERWMGPGNPPESVVQAAVNRARMLVTGWGTPSLKPLLTGWSPEHSPLALVAHTAGSIKFLVPHEAMQCGLTVVHSNDSLAEAVAEFTIAAILGMRRQLFLAASRCQAHLPPPPYYTMRELPGSVVGIIGASAIGRRVMDLLRPWRVKLLLYDPYCPGETARAYEAEQVDLLDLFKRSDIISLHAPITQETIGMLRAEHFASMQNGALFVNTARGILVDHAALLKELQTGRIAALLDVTDPTEPLPPDSPFFGLDNCVLIAHQAGNSLEARLRQGRYIGEDVLAYLEGRPLRHQVHAAQFDRIA